MIDMRDTWSYLLLLLLHCFQIGFEVDGLFVFGPQEDTEHSLGRDLNSLQRRPLHFALQLDDLMSHFLYLSQETPQF